MSTSRRAIFLVALATAVLGGACQRTYPHCKAFEFGDFFSAPTLVRKTVHPEDCGSFTVRGTEAEPLVEDVDALDCAIDGIAGGETIEVSLVWAPVDSDEPERAVIFSDDDGVVMRWRDIDMDLSARAEAKVFQLDTDRVGGCRDEQDPGQRFLCLYEAFDAGEELKTCGTNFFQSE